MAVSLRSWLRWLLAKGPEAIRLEPRPASAAAGQPQSSGSAPLSASLALWSSRLLRARSATALRRQLLAALLLAVVLAGLHVATGLSELALLAAPLLLMISMASSIRRPPLEQVAVLLDERIGLHDLIGTGTELQTQATRSLRPLEQRAVAGAAAAADQSLTRWRARSAPAAVEWSSLLVGVAALGALLALAPTARPRSQAGAERLSATGTPSNGGRTARRSHAHRANHVTAPSPSKPSEFKTPSTHRQPSTSTPATTGRHSSGQAGVKTPRSPGANGSTGLKATSTGAGPKRSSPRAGGSQSSAATGHPATSSSPAAGRTGVSPVTAPKLAGAAAGAKPGAPPSALAGAPNRRSSPTSGPAAAHAGAPAATGRAGHGRGSTRLGGSHQLSGSASKSLPLKAGYAPSHGAGPGSRPAGRGPGGGGHARSQGVPGSSSAEGSSGAPSYVPADGGSAAGTQLITYLASLEWVREQSW